MDQVTVEKVSYAAFAKAFTTAIVADHNDAFRKRRAVKGLEGQIVVTQAVGAVGHDFVVACAAAIAKFDDFNEDNDPHGDHSFGVVNVQGKDVFWKIDLYDTDYHWGSEKPACLETTRRVLTIMFPSDY